MRDTDGNVKAVGPTLWTCKIGVRDRIALPGGADLPMRRAVARAFLELTGREDDFNFSGWGDSLTETEAAVAGLPAEAALLARPVEPRTGPWPEDTGDNYPPIPQPPYTLYGPSEQGGLWSIWGTGWAIPLVASGPEAAMRHVLALLARPVEPTLNPERLAAAIHSSGIASCRTECPDPPEFRTFSGADYDFAQILIREYEGRS